MFTVNLFREHGCLHLSVVTRTSLETEEVVMLSAAYIIIHRKKKKTTVKDSKLCRYMYHLILKKKNAIKVN